MENSAALTSCQPASDLIEGAFVCRLDIQSHHLQIEMHGRLTRLPLLTTAATSLPRQQQRNPSIPRVLQGHCMIDESLHPASIRHGQPPQDSDLTTVTRSCLGLQRASASFSVCRCSSWRFLVILSKRRCRSSCGPFTLR